MNFRKYRKEVVGILRKNGFDIDSIEPDDFDEGKDIEKIEQSIQEYFNEGVEPHVAARGILIDFD